MKACEKAGEGVCGERREGVGRKMGNTLAAPVAAYASSTAAAASAAATSTSSSAAAAAAAASGEATTNEGVLLTTIASAATTTSAEDQMLMPVELDGVFQSRLGGGRLFRTCAALVERDGRVRRVVVKVHLKRPGAPSFAHHVRTVELLGSALEGAAHLLPYTLAFDAETSASLVRRRLWRSLVQRLGVRPFLAHAEKRWLAYQLLRALAESHARGARHGDIKGENIMVTSYGWLYVTDFAWFKPVQLPENNPADFSFYFDTSAGGRRTCTLAPERFVTDVAPEAQLTDAMDIFSAGCVLAELILDGRSLFDLSALLAYKRGEFAPEDALLAGAEDDALASLALEMVALQPEQRGSADEILEKHRGALFPEYYDRLHECFGRLNALDDADAKMRALDDEFVNMCALVAEDHDAGYASTQMSDSRIPPSTSSSAGPQSEKEPSLPHRQSRSLSHDLSCFSEALLSSSSTAATAASRVRDETQIFGLDTDDIGDDDLPAFIDDNDDDDNDDGRRHHDNAKAGVEPGVVSTSNLHDATMNDTNGGRIRSDRVKNSAQQMLSSSSPSVAEVVIECVDEHEMRDSGSGDSGFAPADFGKLWASRALSGATSRKKEAISLPLEGGWMWDGDWKDGAWMYRVAGNAEWTHEPAAEALWRKRQWTRRRVRPARGQVGVSGERERGGYGSGKQCFNVDEDGEGSSMLTKHMRLSADGMCLVSTVVCSASRGARLRESRCQAAKLLHECALHCDNTVRLQRIVPYLVALIADGTTTVKVVALRSLKKVLSIITAFAPSDVRMFPDYILPSLSNLPTHSEEMVRVEYAACITEIAQAAFNFIGRAQYLSSRSVHSSWKNPSDDHDEAEEGEDRKGGGADGQRKKGQRRGGDQKPHAAEKQQRIQEQNSLGWDVRKNDGDGEGVVRAEASEVREMRMLIQKVVMEIMQGASSMQRRALLPWAGALCGVLGRQESNDVILPLLITCLNDRDWQMRASFLAAVPAVAPFVGTISLEAFILPCIEQAIFDPEVAVIEAALTCEATLVRAKLLRRRATIAAAKRAAVLLCHPSPSVRDAALEMVSVAAITASAPDFYTKLAPLILPFAHAQETALSLSQCIPPTTTTATTEVTVAVTEATASRIRAKLMQGLPRDIYGGALDVLRDGGDFDEWVRAQEDRVEWLPVLKAMRDYLASAATFPIARAGDDAVPEVMMMGRASPKTAGETQGVVRRRTSSVTTMSAAIHVVTKEDGMPRCHPNGTIAAARYQPGGHSASVYLEEMWQGSVDLLANQVAAIHTSPESGDARKMSNAAAAAVSASRAATSTSPSSLSSSSSSASNASPKSRLRDTDSVRGRGGQRQRPSSMTQQSRGGRPDSVSDAVHAAVSVSLPPRVAVDWVPRGVLVAHLEEHRGGVAAVCPAASGAFVVSGGEDGTCKVWDVRRLEKDVAFSSRVSYAPDCGAVLAATCMPNSDDHVATGYSDGSLHIWEVEYTVAIRRGASVPDKYKGTSRRGAVSPEEGAVVSLLATSATELLYSTQRGGIHSMDTRSRREAWRLPFNPKGGILSHMVVDPAAGLWLVTGSSRGVVTLWDIRYRVPMSTWAFPGSRRVIDAMCPAAPRGASVDDQMAEPPLVYITSGDSELGLMDARDGRCLEVIRVVSATDAPGTATSSPHIIVKGSGTSAKKCRVTFCPDSGWVGALDSPLLAQMEDSDDPYRVKAVESPQPTPRGAGMQTLLPIHSGMVITAGSDKTIRMWNCTTPNESYCISAPAYGDIASPIGAATSFAAEHAGQSSTPRSMTRVVSHDHCGARIVQELPAFGSPIRPDPATQNSDASGGIGTAHQDAIQSLCITPAPQRLLVSGSRDGVIKVWK